MQYSDVCGRADCAAKTCCYAEGGVTTHCSAEHVMYAVSASSVCTNVQSMADCEAPHTNITYACSLIECAVSVLDVHMRVIFGGFHAIMLAGLVSPAKRSANAQ